MTLTQLKQKVLRMFIAQRPPKRSEAMYLTGMTLLSCLREVGKPEVTSEGHPILWNEFYVVDERGIRRVD